MLADANKMMAAVARLVVRFLLNGLRSIESSEGQPFNASQQMMNVPAEVALSIKAVGPVRDVAFRKRSKQLRAKFRMRNPQKPGPTSVDELTHSLTPQIWEGLEQSNKELEQDLCIAVGREGHINIQMRTVLREITATLAEAKMAGKAIQVTAFLEHKEQTATFRMQKRSLPQVTAKLRCLHNFAFGAFGVVG